MFFFQGSTTPKELSQAVLITQYRYYMVYYLGGSCCLLYDISNTFFLNQCQLSYAVIFKGKANNLHTVTMDVSKM